jgi:uncharacterized protein YkwD
MRQVCLIVLCLFLAGGAGAAPAASAHHQGKRHSVPYLGERHKLCNRRHKRSKGCRPRKQNVRQTSADVRQTSAEPSAVALPPLEELIAPEPDCPGQSDESLSVASQEATMGCMINFARRAAGEAGLAGVAPLNESTADKASDIVVCGEFSHTACGRPFTYWLEQDGYLQPGECQQAGENLAWGTGELGTVRSILSAWVNSPEHLANMLTAAYGEFGVSMEVGQLDGYPDAHVWVTHFGSHC